MAKQYIAFISYRHAELDSAIAKQLHTLIEQYRIPKGLRKDNRKRLGIVFRDEEELPAASNLTTEIQTALDNTSYLIVICSKDAIQSPWCAREIDYFLQHHDRSHVLAVLASGEPVDVFPKQLTMSPDGPDAPPIEPLALDVRAESIAASCKKLRKGILRLISSILGCPYDALVMREQKRKTRRITAIAAGAMAILLGFTSMVLAKNQEIALANTQLEHKNVELNDANTALAEQKAAVQLRESQLLTQNAEEDMANADYDSAIENALAALPQDKSDDRPYYAPAEAILMDALGIFRTQEGEVALNTTTVQQVTNIADYVISNDGSRIVTIDGFGTIFCFDTKSGDQLWNQYASQEDSSSSTNPHLILCNEDQTVVRSGHRSVCGYDMQTGDLLWSTDVGFLVEDYLFYHAGHNSVLLVAYHTVETFSTAYQLTEVDVATGQILQTFPLAVSDNSTAFSFSSPYNDMLSKGGFLSGDGTQFYGVFLDDLKQMQLFCANLTTGTSQTLYTHDVPMIYGTTVLSMGVHKNALYIALKDPGENIALRAMKLDLETRKPLWQQDIPCGDGIYFSSSKGYALFFESSILMAVNNNLHYLDSNTGEILLQKTAPGIITSMTFISQTEFGFSLDNGTYGIGWTRLPNIVELTTDPSWQVFAPIKEHKDFRVWGGGIVQLDVSNDGFWLGVGNRVSPGYVLLIPEDEPNTIEIIRPVQPLSVLKHAPLQLPELGLKTSSSCKIQRIGSRLALGPLHTSSDYSDLYYMLDPATLKVVDTYDPEGNYYSNELYWLPETCQPLICDSYDGIYTIDADGNQTLLHDPHADQEALGEEDAWWSSYALFRCASEYQSDGKTLLTASCNPKLLRIWKNGVALPETDIPESLKIPAKETLGKARMLMVGTNGYILTSLHNDSEPIPVGNMAAYNPDQNTWTLLQGKELFANDKSIAMAKNKPLLAGLDQDGSLRLLDLRTGNTVGHFSTQLPSGSVLQMQFFMDDTLLAIKASGGHLLIYEVATGKQLYRDQLSANVSNTLQIFEDLKHRRLYLNYGSNSGLCLDLDSWTALSRPTNLFFFDSSTGLTYLSGNYGGQSSISYGEIPDTMELVKLAKATLTETT